MPSQPTARRYPRGVVIAAVLTGVVSYAVMQSVIAPVLPELQRQLHTSQNLVTWVMTGYLLSASVCTPIVGRLGDRYGKHRLLFATLVAMAIGCLLSALAPSIGMMIAGRIVQGAAGGVLPLAFGIIRDETPAEKISSAIGLAASLAAVGGGLGIVLAGPLTDALGIRSLFWIATAVAALAAVAARIVVPASPVSGGGRISPRASLLLAAWLLALLIPLAEASSWGWASTKVLGLLALAVVIAAWWVHTESRSASPLVDMRLMRNRTVWSTNLVTLLMGTGLYAVTAFVPAFAQTPVGAGYGFGASVTGAGLLLLPITVAMFFSGLTASRLTRRLGTRPVLVIAAALITTSDSTLAFAHAHPWQVAAATAALGAGFGAAFATIADVTTEAVRPDQTGVANGINANVRTIGGSIGTAVMGSILAAHTTTGGLATEQGYTTGFAVLAIACLAAVFAALLVPTRRHDGRTIARNAPETAPLDTADA